MDCEYSEGQDQTQAQSKGSRQLLTSTWTLVVDRLNQGAPCACAAS